MINQCNFKYTYDKFTACRIQLQQGGTDTSLVKCIGEDNCMLYQIYKMQYHKGQRVAKYLKCQKEK